MTNDDRFSVGQVDPVGQVEQTMIGLGRGRPGERVVIVAGRPGQEGSTNSVCVHRLGSSGPGPGG